MCAKHWPPGFKTVKVHGKDRPASPPSKFYVAPSLIPTTPAKKRSTKRTSTVRSLQADEPPGIYRSRLLSFLRILLKRKNTELTKSSFIKAILYGQNICIQSTKSIAGIPR